MTTEEVRQELKEIEDHLWALYTEARQSAKLGLCDSDLAKGVTTIWSYVYGKCLEMGLDV